MYALSEAPTEALPPQDLRRPAATTSRPQTDKASQVLSAINRGMRRATQAA